MVERDSECLTYFPSGVSCRLTQAISSKLRSGRLSSSFWKGSFSAIHRMRASLPLSGVGECFFPKIRSRYHLPLSFDSSIPLKALPLKLLISPIPGTYTGEALCCVFHIRSLPPDSGRYRPCSGCISFPRPVCRSPGERSASGRPAHTFRRKYRHPSHKISLHGRIPDKTGRSRFR